MPEKSWLMKNICMSGCAPDHGSSKKKGRELNAP